VDAPAAVVLKPEGESLCDFIPRGVAEGLGHAPTLAGLWEHSKNRRDPWKMSPRTSTTRQP
jgi:hypothetical protein